MALKLARKKGECVVIDGCIVITVESIKGSIVNLAIEAPRHVPVDRLEIHEIRTQRTPAKIAG